MGSATGYMRVLADREFSADASVSMRSGANPSVSVEESYRQNWLEYALGVSGKTGENSVGSLEVMRTNDGKTHGQYVAALVGIRAEREQ